MAKKPAELKRCSGAAASYWVHVVRSGFGGPLNWVLGGREEGDVVAGKFLRRGAIVDTIKSEHRTNAIQKRQGLTQHPVTVTSCGCPDPNCGCWHTIQMGQTIPTAEEAAAALAADKKARKASERVRKANAMRAKRKRA